MCTPHENPGGRADGRDEAGAAGRGGRGRTRRARPPCVPAAIGRLPGALDWVVARFRRLTSDAYGPLGCPNGQHVAEKSDERIGDC